MARKLIDKEFEDRFWQRVNKIGDCWLWTGGLNFKGYGNFSARRNGQMFWKAHRYSWALHNEKIPKDMMVLHSCDNPWCVNPEHLSLGTSDDNIRQRNERGRTAHGRNTRHVKLQPEDVIHIRISDKTHSELAREYDVNPSTIAMARTGQKWKHLPMPGDSE